MTRINKTATGKSDSTGSAMGQQDLSSSSMSS